MSLEWLTAGPAGWQELAAAVIVGLAVVSLYRHLRDVFGTARSSGGPACSSCGSGGCEETASSKDSVATPSTPAGATPVTTIPGGTPR